MPKSSIFIRQRPRRNRATASIRSLIRETELNPSHLIWPCFVEDGPAQTAVKSMPGVFKYNPDALVKQAKIAFDLGIRAMALFPSISEKKKDSLAKESTNPKGLLQTTLKKLKDKVPEMLLISDVAMDPYSSDGHDGVVKNGKILNDQTLEILGQMALSQVQAGADWIAPSDMMDGRVGYLRKILDQNGHQDVGILAYSAKYASAFYGPFREALKSAPKHGDKKTYQMDPANAREALREVKLDVSEGADMVMVKPALAYLDIISQIRKTVTVPVAAYQVSGEYAMIMAAHQNGWIDGPAVMKESLLSIRRAGADAILSYWALDFAKDFAKV